MIALLGLWSHALAALLFGALAVFQLRHWNGDPRNRPLVGAFAVTALWAIFTAVEGPGGLLSGLAEAARNFAFLAFMYGIVRRAEENDRQQALKVVYATIAGVIGLQVVIAGVLPRFADEPEIAAALTSTSYVIGLTIAAGSLVLVHNVYGQAAPQSRWGLRLPALALAAMWGFDLHLYTVSYLGQGGTQDLFALRGAILSMTAPLFVLASRRNAEWSFRLSRAATFQSFSVIAILFYLVVMLSGTRAMSLMHGDWVRAGQLGFLFAMTLAALLLIPSAKARGWLRVVVAKHFFEHRYDYREEWLAFTRTIAVAGDDAAPLGERVVKALADLADAPAGLLLMADERRLLYPHSSWNWRGETGEIGAEALDLVRLIEERRHVIDFDALIDGAIVADGRCVPVPAWLAVDGAAWAGVPLLHNDALVGLVVLAHPAVRRPLDWEDFDLFRTAGIQAASHLAEARGQEALASAHRFDEFNRRFAFIMHDIKNLVSQLSLVTRNAERHADNPAFRADMIATLQGSVKKMNDLLARLSNDRPGEGGPPRPIRVGEIASALARRRDHVVTVAGDGEALADAAGLEQALGHLVQNAIDASPDGRPVRIEIVEQGDRVEIVVADEGTGMSADFVRGRLFQPFASTKQGGFGIGAFEARSLVVAMGGSLDVDSAPGAGTRFRISLPSARERLVA